MVFGVSLIFTGLFRHAPIQETMPYDIFEDQIHSLASTAVGFSFTILSLSAVFIEKNLLRKIIALFTGSLTTCLSILMVVMPAYAGIWQRAILIIAIAWIIFFLHEKDTQ